MVASLLRVVYGGIQDAEIICQKGKPNIKFFIRVFIRPGRFTTQWIRLDFDTRPTLGNSATITLPRKGQLISRLYLVTTMPDISTSQLAAQKWCRDNGKTFAGPTFGWTNSVGHAILQQATITIGGTRVEQIDGRLLEVLDDFTTPLEKVSLMDKLLPRSSTGFTSGRTEAFIGASRVASGSHDTTVRVWDTASGICLRVLEGHTDAVYSVCFLGDGALASGSLDGTVRIWDIESGRCKHVLHDAGEIGSVCLFGKNQIASGLVGKISIWDIKTGQLVKRFLDATMGPTHVCDLGDGLLGSGSYDKKVRVWDVKNGVVLQTMSGHTDWIWCVCAIEGGRIASGGGYADQKVRIWDVKTGALLRILSVSGNIGTITNICALSNGRLAATSYDDTIRIWNTNTGNVVNIPNQGYIGLCSLDGEKVTSTGFIDNKIQICDIRSGLGIKALDAASAGPLGGHTDFVGCVCAFDFLPSETPSFGGDSVTRATTPLPFWFSSGDAGTFLPIDAIQADPVVLNINFAALNTLYVSSAQVKPTTANPVGGGAYYPLASSPFYYRNPNGVDISGLDGFTGHSTQVFAVPGITIPTAETLQILGDTYLMAEYIYLDRAEANRFRLADIQVPILQHYAFEPVDSKSGNVVNCYLKIPNPTRNLYFYAQRYEAPYYNARFLATRDLSGSDHAIAPWWPDASEIGTRVLNEIQPAFVFSDSEPIRSIELIYSGSLYRYATATPSVYRSLIPSLEQRKSPWVNRYYYNLPFAFQSGTLAPSQPCGEANLDKIVNINLKIGLKPFRGFQAAGAVPRVLIYAWAETYNIFRVYGGRAGMMFAY